MKRHRILYPVLAAFVLCATCWPALADAPPAAGWWEGSVEMPDSAMAVQIELSLDEAGAWSGLIHIPVQGIHDLPLEEIQTGDAEVGFTMQGVMGNPRFAGRLSEDARSLTGQFQHSNYSFPFSLARRDKPFEDASVLFDAYLKPGVPAEGVEGAWLGIMEAGVAKLRMDLTITRAADGSLAGTINSPDQQSGNLPIDSMTIEEDLLTFSIVSIGGHFVGRVKPDGSLLLGRWTQARAEFPILFRRQPPAGVSVEEAPSAE